MGGTYGGDRPSGKDTATTAKDAVTVGTSSATIAAANESRVELFVANDHASNVLYLALGTPAVANKGIRLGPGQSVVISSYGGQVTGIASGASTVACVAEV